jgi:NAD(P)-dependent dehydrogenase (short-subunit alcohol dehydrogenase family)
MTHRMQDKVVMITGAGSVGEGWGNGKASAVLYAREGAKVFAVDIRRSAAEETQSTIRDEGGVCEVGEADVSMNIDVERAVRSCVASFGRIDILHNNVGVLSAGGPVELEEKEWDRVVAVNQKSMFLTCKHVIPYMLKQGNGAIVNVSSLGAIRWIGVPYIAYATSKGAVISFTRSIALQYARERIRANCVLPGLMDTPMIREPLKGRSRAERDRVIESRHAASPTGKMGTAWDVAYAALYLASDEARYVTGTEIVVDGGLSVRAVSDPVLPTEQHHG